MENFKMNRYYYYSCDEIEDDEKEITEIERKIRRCEIDGW